MPKQKSTVRSDGYYEIKRTIPAEYSPDGVSYRKSFYSTISKQDCINQYNAFLLDLGRASASGIRLPSENKKFKEWAHTWLTTYKKGKVKDSTYAETYERTVNNYLIPHFGEYELDKIKPIDIQTFLNDAARRMSDSTLSKMRLCLNSIFESAADNNIIIKNPVKNIKVKSTLKKEEKNTYTQEQYDTIIAFARTHPNGHLIRLMLEVGLRISEMCGVQFGDVDSQTQTLHLRRTCTSVNYRAYISEDFKNNTSRRSIPITRDLCDHICRVVKKHKLTDFMCTGTSEPKAPTYFTKHKYRMFFKDLNAVYPDIPVLSPHELRHTCGTLLYARSKDIYAVSKYLGHANIDITVKTYVHDSADLLRDHLQIR